MNLYINTYTKETYHKRNSSLETDTGLFALFNTKEELEGGSLQFKKLEDMKIMAWKIIIE